MAIERRLDGFIKLAPSRIIDGRDQVLRLPTPFAAVWQDTVALNTRVGSTFTFKSCVPGSLGPSKLRTKFFKPFGLRAVKCADIVPVEIFHHGFRRFLRDLLFDTFSVVIKFPYQPGRVVVLNSA